jgi:uncharacterized membrane protein YfcA
MLAALLGLVIGFVMGGLGGGGGALAVPALVYLLGLTAQDATTTSVVVVGITAVVGVLVRLRGGLIKWRTGLAFGAVGIPSAAVGTLINQRAAQPVLLLSFAALALIAAIAMIIDSRERPAVSAGSAGPDPEPVAPAGRPVERRGAVAVEPRSAVVSSSTTVRVLKIVLCGVVIGFLTGFLGVGGGFLMVPALVIVLRMPMMFAVGTSMLIMAINAVAALGARVGVSEFDWAVLVPFTIAAVAASIVGKRVSVRLSSAALGRAFAVMLLLVGAYTAVESIVAL